MDSVILTMMTPFSTATVTFSDDYVDSISYAQDLIAYIAKNHSCMNIEIISSKRPITISGPWLTITKLEIALKTLFYDTAKQDFQSADSDSNGKDHIDFEYWLAKFQELPDITVSVTLPNSMVELSNNNTQLLEKSEQLNLYVQDVDESHAETEDIIHSQVIETKQRTQDDKQTFARNDSLHVKSNSDNTDQPSTLQLQEQEGHVVENLDSVLVHKHLKVDEVSSEERSWVLNVISPMSEYPSKFKDLVSVPNPVIVCQSYDEQLRSTLNNNVTGKPNIKDVEQIFDHIYSEDTKFRYKSKSKNQTSRNDEGLSNGINKSDEYPENETGSKDHSQKGSDDDGVEAVARHDTMENKCGKHSERKTRSQKMSRSTTAHSSSKQSCERKITKQIKHDKTRKSNNKRMDDNDECDFDAFNLVEVKQERTLDSLDLFHCDKGSNEGTELQENIEKHENEQEEDKKMGIQINGQYACDECGFLTSQYSYLIAHKKRIHLDKHFKCTKCPKKFGLLGDFNKHVKCHMNIRYHCDICGKTYSAKRKLKEHKEVHSKDYVKPEFQCKFCDKSFCTKYVLAYHIKDEHLGVRKSYVCPTCGKSFTQRGSYLQHANTIHLGLKPFACDVCNKKFAYEKSLREHKFIHSDKKLFKCTICAKSFQQSSGLAVHRRIHKSLKDYVCSACGKGFSQRPALVRHERIHSGEKPYECALCSKYFSDPSVLRRHMISIHEKDTSCWREDIVTHFQKPTKSRPSKPKVSEDRQ